MDVMDFTFRIDLSLKWAVDIQLTRMTKQLGSIRTV